MDCLSYFETDNISQQGVKRRVFFARRKLARGIFFYPRALPEGKKKPEGQFSGQKLHAFSTQVGNSIFSYCNKKAAPNHQTSVC